MKKMTRLVPDTRIVKLSRWDWIALLLAVLIGGMLATLSVARYRGYNAGMLDIGNMSQAIWSATQGQPLEYTHEDGTFSRLAWHIEVIYFLIAPLYALFPDPRTLLVLQSLLYMLGALPAYRIAKRHFGQHKVTIILMLCYLLYPTALTAVLADFHGDTLAMPLLLFALDAFERRDWRHYTLWIALSLLCKVYVAVPVIALGVTLWLKGERKAGFLTALGGLFWGLLAVLVIGPAFTPPGVYQAQATPFSYFMFYFGRIKELLLPTMLPRLMNAFIVFIAVVWLGCYAPLWLLPAYAVALPALVGVGDVITYHYNMHHYALSVPFMFYAMVLGAAHLRRRQLSEGTRTRRGRTWIGDTLLSFGIIMILNMALVNTPLSPRFWLKKPGFGLDQWSYGRVSRDALKDRWLSANVPAEVPIAASEMLAPHLANRPTLYLVRYPYGLKRLGQIDSYRESRYLLFHPDQLDELFLWNNLSKVDYVVADALFDYVRFLDAQQTKVLYGTLYDTPGIMAVLHDPSFGLREERDGLLLFERGLPATQALSQKVQVVEPLTSLQIKARFGGSVGLVDTFFQPMDARRFRLQYDWTALCPQAEMPLLIAVSRIEGVPHSRYIHLPTLALYPTVRWEPGQIVREKFEIELPPDLPSGEYALWVGWYDSSHPHAFETDDRSRVGEEVKLGTLWIGE